MHLFLKFILEENSECFGQFLCPSSGVLRAGSGWNCVLSWSCSQAVSRTIWHTPLLCLWCRTPRDGQKNCPKHVEFYSKINLRNKFIWLVLL